MIENLNDYKKVCYKAKEIGINDFCIFLTAYYDETIEPDNIYFLFDIIKFKRALENYYGFTQDKTMKDFCDEKFGKENMSEIWNLMGIGD